jgi:hypothetical protein
MRSDDYYEIVDIAISLNEQRVKIGGRLAQKVRMAAKRCNHPARQQAIEMTSSAG